MFFVIYVLISFKFSYCEWDIILCTTLRYQKYKK
jgi:hypothetical protein